MKKQIAIINIAEINRFTEVNGGRISEEGWDEIHEDLARLRKIINK